MQIWALNTCWLACRPAWWIILTQKNKHESRERTLATLPLLGGSLAVILTRAHHTGARGGGSDARKSVINWTWPLHRWVKRSLLARLHKKSSVALEMHPDI